MFEEMLTTEEDLKKMFAQDVDNLKSMTYDQLLNHEKYLNNKIKKAEKKGIDTYWLQRELKETEETINALSL